MHTISDLHSIFEDEFSALAEKPCSYPWLMGEGDRKRRIHITGLGDVGRTAAVALRVLGADIVDTIGLYDLNEAQAARMEMELNQIGTPCGRTRLPEAVILREEDLFACDVFLYCATKAVPAVGSGTQDVRMAQYEANRGIISIYARKAAQQSFAGLFGVVSDPVDLLCMAALLASREENGFLHPEQIQGFGLGVMYARAAYYARMAEKNGETGAGLFREEGRVFGPHGKGLVAANSIFGNHYDSVLSDTLTRQTVTANLEMRALGFKPYLAPAFSSAAYSVLAAISGEWCDSARYLHGLYFGARNRTSCEGTVWEETVLPEELAGKVEAAYHDLEALL